MLKDTTKAVAILTTGTYRCTFNGLRDGKTSADTVLTFTAEDGKRIATNVNNSRVIYTSPEGEDFTSEDFFMIGLKRQLKIAEEVSPLEVLRACTETPITLWVVVDDEYTNVYSSKPKTFDSAELGIC